MDDHELAYRIHRTSAIVSVVNSLFRWAGLVGLGVCLVLVVRSLAGQHTDANIMVRMLGDFRFSETVAWMFGAGGVAYGMKQRQLRRSVNESLGTRTSSLERLIDPGRTSSLLTATGQTNPQDQL